MAARKHYPLPKRFSVAMTDKAYTRLRQLNAEYGFGNNYLLTFLLENLDEFADQAALERVFTNLIAEFGNPDRPDGNP